MKVQVLLGLFIHISTTILALQLGGKSSLANPPSDRPATNQSQSTLLPKQLTHLIFNSNAVPKGKKAPGRRASGGRRPNSENPACPQLLDKGLTALVSERKERISGNKEVQSVLGLSASEPLTLWFYVPYTEPLQAKLTLVNDQGNHSYLINLPKQAGIVGLALPPQVTQSLKVDQQYRWGLSIICHPMSPSLNPNVSGWLQRVELPALSSSESVSEKLLYYANRGIWHDALTLLANQRMAKPNDAIINQYWGDLLDAEQLGNLSGEAIVQQYFLNEELKPVTQ
ncbi:DUF928 domain-containing protein [Trichocoleus sp. FACHB-262]|uniref:DUF928 domain-containing protein n=1 Tax=Trichocoleus sp. FACHB-262 TaxID=2692869 RepID=UPI0016854B69|nr:DUF928 domain-containing protein [Trichocoleus sp. FACHB-262]MBD2121875.1 DUF928 domain-containing protein [Trichocoleus sp. FACHB-262]